MVPSNWADSFFSDGIPSVPCNLLRVYNYNDNSLKHLGYSAKSTAVTKEKQSKFTILQWNARGVSTNSTKLYEIIQEYKPTFICLQEGHTQYPLYFEPPHCNGYHAYHDPYGKCVTYVKDTLRPATIYKSARLKETSVIHPREKIHGIILRIPVHFCHKQNYIYLANFYRSPNCPSRTAQLIWPILDPLISDPLAHGSIWKLVGDFNSCDAAWGAEPPSRTYDKRYIDGAELAHSLLTRQWRIANDGKATHFTHDQDGHCKVSHLDISCTLNLPERYEFTQTIQKDFNSDHYPILTVLENTKQKFNIPSKPTWAIPPTEHDSWILFQEFFTKYAEDWKEKWKGNMRCRADIHAAVSHLIACYHTAANAIFGTKCRKGHWKPWISKKLEAASIAYHRAYRHWKKTKYKNQGLWRKLCQLRRCRNRLQKLEKANWLEKKFSESALRGRAGWQIAAEVRNLHTATGQAVPPLRDEKGDISAESAEDKAALFRDHFHRWDSLESVPLPSLQRPHQAPECITSEADESAPAPNGEMALLYHRHQRRQLKKIKRHPKYHAALDALNKDIPARELLRIIRSFGNNKAMGPDHIHILFIKKTIQQSSDVLGILFTAMFHTGFQAPVLKSRWIIPICKPSKPAYLAASYRPISLTSYIAKILEKCMAVRLVTYIIKVQINLSFNFGFLRGRSSIDCVVHVVDYITECIRQKRKPCHALFWDFSSAFDMVRQDILCWKLQFEFGIHGRFLAFVTELLSNRFSRVILDGFQGPWNADPIGVPQGGSLSPLFFVLYIDALRLIDEFRGIHIAKFADDVAIFSTIGTPQGIIRDSLQKAISFMIWYSAQVGLKLNASKSHYMVFTTSRTPDIHTLQLFFNGKPFVQEKKAVRYLGIYLDPQLNWKYHLGRTIRKSWMIFGVITRGLRGVRNINADIRRILYQACVLSIMDYGAVFYGKLSKKAVQPFQVLYRAMIRTILGAHRTTPIGIICLLLHWHPLLDHWSGLRVQYLSHLFRMPKSSILASRFATKWWPWIHKWCSEQSSRNWQSWKPIFDSLNKTQINTTSPICNCITDSMLLGASDCLMITAATRISDINPQISYYVPILRPPTNLHCLEFTYCDPVHPISIQDNTLLIFTDGSVKDFIGGAGIHMIDRYNYFHWTKMLLERRIVSLNKESLPISSDSESSTTPPPPEPGTYEDLQFGTHPLGPVDEFGIQISTRCSIDFCEMIAIRESLRTCIRQKYYRTWQKIHIITDSQTCLRWISGKYILRHFRTYDLVADIYRSLQQLSLQRIKVRIQWVKAHNACGGNERADRLAKLGMESLMNSSPLKQKRIWRGCSIRSIQKLAMRTMTHRVNANWVLNIRPKLKLSAKFHQWNVTYGGCFANEHKLLSYTEIRILTRLRSEHTGLNYHLWKKYKAKSNGKCPHCTAYDTTEHLLLHCPHGTQWRSKLYANIDSLYTMHHMDRCVKAHDLGYKDPRKLKWMENEEKNMLFPPPSMQLDTRCHILREVCKFVRHTGRLNQFF